MVLLNFSHPLRPEEHAKIKELTGLPPEQDLEELEIPVQFENDHPYVPQLQALVDAIPLTRTQWQTEPILLNIPSLNFITALLLAELHGRMGYFPSILRLRPVPDSTPQRYEVYEILNLQAVREQSRMKRQMEGVSDEPAS